MSNDASLDINQKSNPVQTVAPPKEDNNMLRATDKITALYCRLSVEDTKEKGGKSSVAGALADFQKSAGGAGGGGGGEEDLVDLLLRVRSKKRLGLSHLSELSLKRLYVVHNCGSSVFR